MKKYALMIVWIISPAIFLTACAGEKKLSQVDNASAFFPEDILTADVKKVSEITAYTGQSLFEYINGGAEIYHAYKFIEVATADYKFDEIELILDIYRFENADYAFGLYSALRPPEPDYIKLGVEGYISSTRLEFLKGKYLVRLTAYEESPEVTSAMATFAEEIDKSIPGRTTLPEVFSLFPVGDIVPGTDRLLAESYLGHAFLAHVYTRDYVMDDVTVTLFLTKDKSGDKFRQWKDIPTAAGNVESDPVDLPFDEINSIHIPESYYGRIVGGVKGPRLIGMVNYHPDHSDNLTAWFNTFP